MIRVLYRQFNPCCMSQITIHLVRLAHLIVDIVFSGNVDQGDDVHVCHVLTREMMSMFVMC